MLFRSDQVTIMLDVDNVSLESVNIRVRHEGAADMLWVYMLTADLQTSAQQLLEEKIEADKPKTVFADAVTASDSAVLVRDLAKMIRQNGYEIGEKRLYNWMRENGYICKGTTMPTQKAMELGLFEIEIRTIERGVGLPLERKTTKVTGKGQIYFANKFLA